MGWEGLIFAAAFIVIAFLVVVGGRRRDLKFPIRQPDREAERRAAENALKHRSPPPGPSSSEKERDRKAG
jgi:hypothetical protein